MTDFTKTMTLVAVAAALGLLVFLTRPAGRDIALLNDQGQPLTPELTDPQKVTALEVVSFDEAASKLRAFKIAFDGKRWVIPSHGGYQADATDKVAAAASAFIDLQKEQIISESKNDHARLGLLSPDDEHPGAAPGSIGTRVTVSTAEKPVVNLIIGKAFGSATGSSPFDAASNKKYVREVGRNRVYVTTLTTGFSTKFTDWVQTDLLKTSAQQIVAVGIDRYRIDEEKGTLVDRQTLELSKPAFDPQNSAAERKWKLEAKPGGGPGDGQVVNETRVEEITSTLTGLRIVGVRPKPANLSKVLSGTDTTVNFSLPDQLSLQERGFFLTPRRQFVANDGQMTIRCSDGVTYQLWLGEVVPEGEDAASGGRVGTDTPASATPGTESADPPKSEKPANSKGAESRYLMVTVNFDEKQLPEPRKPEVLANLPTPVAPKTDAESTPEDAAAEPPEIATARQAHAAALQEWSSLKESGKKRAEELSRRFADWYYVIDGQSVTKLRPTRDELVIPDPAKVNPASTPDAPGPGQPPAPSGVKPPTSG